MKKLKIKRLIQNCKDTSQDVKTALNKSEVFILEEKNKQKHRKLKKKYPNLNIE